MKKGLAVALVTSAVCLWAVGASAQSPNPGTLAYLSFSSTDTTVTDFTNVGAGTASLYVIYYRAAGINFKGAEIDLTWDPPSDGLGCFDRLGHFFKTSSTTTCTYLNRGTSVPVVTDDTPTHFHVAWANDTVFTGCTLGAVVQIQYDVSGCVDATGCFRLNSALILGTLNAIDVVQVQGGGIATVLGGGTHCVPLPVRPSTWGKIKDLYRK